jgi:integrase
MSAANVVRLRSMPVEPVKPKPPGRRSNAEHGRTRPYLTEAEVLKLVSAARKRSRYGVRDAAAILLAYRHGLRVSELVGLQWSQIDLSQSRLAVSRLKGSDDSTHPIQGDELRLLRQLRRDRPETRHVFVSERGDVPPRREWFNKLLARTAIEAGMPPGLVHPHALRHGTGYKLANDGADTRSIQLYLGHRQIQHTVRYTKLSERAFAGFKWRPSS